MARVELKAAALLVLLAGLVIGSVLYVLYARGAFEPTQRLVLLADDSEGVTVGMDLTFSGFPIGRVRRVELASGGNARILIDVPTRDWHWLRQSSVFTLVRSLVGATSIRAYSGVLTDPPLPAGAERPVLSGDATAELPQLVSATRELVANLGRLTAADSALAATLFQLQSTTERLNGRQGALGVLMGNEADARQVVVALERSNALLARLEALTAHTDQRLYGPGGLMQDTQATVQQMHGLLVDARASLKKADAILVDAQAIAGQTRSATADLGALRTEVEASLRKVERLVDEVNRRWPFARDPELKLP
ncbi:MAG: MlaD family protein [Aquabacterium sp.]|nr:MlaD family protein [Aquabacterium sp.]